MSDLTLTQVSDYMKKFVARGTTPRNIGNEFEFLYSLLSPTNVRMRFEQIGNDGATSHRDVNAITQNTRTRRNKETADTHILSAPDFSFMNEEGMSIGRVLLTQIRLKSNFNIKLSFEANGAVLCSNTWDILVYPANAFNPHGRKRNIIDNIDKYTIYPIDDGTTVNVYYYNSRWCFSSTNAYEINNYKWIGDLTYEEAFFEALALYPEFSFDSLSPDYCYSFGFRHRNFHPFVADKPRVWLIKCVNVVNGVDATFECKIPYQTGMSVDEFLSKRGVVVKNNVERYNALITMTQQALGKYLNSVIPNSKTTRTDSIETLANNVSRDDINYGFILRAPFDECGSDSNLIMESTLFKTIRQFIYNLPKNSQLHDLKASGVVLDDTNRLEFCIIRSYLDVQNRALFLKLFPQYRPRYDKYDLVIGQVVSAIIKCSKNRKDKPAMSITSNATAVDKLTLAFMRLVIDKIQFNPYDSRARTIVTNAIVSTSFTELYFCVFQKTE